MKTIFASPEKFHFSVSKLVFFLKKMEDFSGANKLIFLFSIHVPNF